MPKWTKQTYEMVANILHESLRDARELHFYFVQDETGKISTEPQVWQIAHKLADRFEADNYGFNRAKFEEAVGTGKHIRSSERALIGRIRSECPNVGRKRINPDGTENWCNRNGLDKCGICDLNPNLD